MQPKCVNFKQQRVSHECMQNMLALSSQIFDHPQFLFLPDLVKISAATVWNRLPLDVKLLLLLTLECHLITLFECNELHMIGATCLVTASIQVLFVITDIVHLTHVCITATTTMVHTTATTTTSTSSSTTSTSTSTMSISTSNSVIIVRIICEHETFDICLLVLFFYQRKMFGVKSCSYDKVSEWCALLL